MSDNENESTSGGDSDSSGSEKSKKEESTSGDASNTENALLQKVLKEKKNAMLALAEKDARVKELENEKLVQKEEYKTLAEQYKGELDKANEKNEDLTKTIFAAKKNKVILDELKSLGLNDKSYDIALKLFDKSKVSIDEATGVAIGAKDAAKSFYDSHSHLNIFGTKKPGVNQDAPEADTGVPGSDEAYIKELKATKTQREYDEVRLKYGRI